MAWPKGKPQSPEQRQKLSDALKGKSKTPEAIAHMCTAQKTYWQSPKADERRERHRQRAMGNTLGVGHIPSMRQREATRRANTGNKYSLGYQHTLEAREKIRKAALNRSPEWREMHRQSRLRHRLPTQMTSLEVALQGEFKKRRLRFEMHKTMFGRFQPDFVFEDVKLIVQADGDYWHRKSRLKGSGEAAERDIRFNKAAAAEEWTVWRFAESEIRQHPEACGRAVARFVRSH